MGKLCNLSNVCIFIIIIIYKEYFMTVIFNFIMPFHIFSKIVHMKLNYIQMVSDWWWFDNFFTLWWCESDMLWIVNFRPPPGLALCHMILSRDAGQWQLQLPVSQVITRVNSRHIYNHPIPIRWLCFSRSVQHSINDMRYSTLYYKNRLCVRWFYSTVG